MFSLRIWQEPVAHGESEWRGKVQRLPYGEVHYFRTWPDLITHLERELAAPMPVPIQIDQSDRTDLVNQRDPG